MEQDFKRILKQYWGYENFRSLQEEIIRYVVAGQDTLALMPTGGGKSITYQVAGLVREGVCLVITPLIALMKDQVEDLQSRQIPAEAIYTGMPLEQVESALHKSIAGRIKFLYISPERLASEAFRIRLKRMNIALIAVDEAHCISQWGYDFRPSYLRIAEVRTFFPAVPVLALTATATPQVVEDIQKQLKFAAFHVLSKSFRRENITYVVRQTTDKLGELAAILMKMPCCAIVYVRTRERAEELAKFLCAKGVCADYYHAGLTALQRAQKQENWKNDTVPVVVATNAFGMGIDKPDVRMVIHFDIPDSPEAYFQEAGRAGRDGKRAYAVLLCNEAALTAMKNRISKSFPEKAFIRKVYHDLGNFFQLEEGEGGGRAFEFDAGNFTKTFKLELAKVLSAIKILQTSGYLECTTEVHAQSRVTFLVARDQLYHLKVENELQEHLVELFLRTCPGIFVQYAYVREELLAEKLGVKRQDIYKALLSLSRQQVIRYVPGNDRPYMVYTQPRLPASYLLIGREAYEDRKEAYENKVLHMVSYARETEKCRQLMLMDYFGQRENEPCGTCDVCLSRKGANRTAEKKKIDLYILQALKEGEREVKEIVRSLEEDPQLVVSRIRLLLDAGKIYYKTPLVLALKEN